MSDVGITKETIIYHYMEIKYLCGMLDNGTFHISRKCYFKDKYEKELLTKKKWFAFSLIGDNVHQQNTNVIQESINKRRMQFKIQSSLLTSCWSLGPRENSLMWENYATVANGICIKTTIGKFAESLCVDSYELLCGKIQYMSREQTTNIKDAEWMKNPEYLGENEIRFYFKEIHQLPFPIHDKKDAVYVGIDYRTLIDKIILSPGMPKDEKQRWREYLSKAYMIKEKDIIDSSIELEYKYSMLPSETIL